jgi:hypothetical protein
MTSRLRSSNERQLTEWLLYLELQLIVFLWFAVSALTERYIHAHLVVLDDASPSMTSTGCPWRGAPRCSTCSSCKTKLAAKLLCKGEPMKSYRYTQNGSLMETPEPHQEEQDSKISLWIDALLLVACIVAGLLVFMAGYNVFMDMFNQLTHLFPGG